LLAILAVWLIGCQSPTAESPQSTPLPIATSAVAETAVLSTVTAPTPTPPPPIVATSATVFEATSTSPALVADTTSVPIPGLIGPDNFPANVNPLTGETVNDPAVLARRPLAIKVSNAPAIVRPGR
jgi:hypothetical protein